MGPSKIIIGIRVCSKSFIVEIDSKFQIVSKGCVRVIILNSPTTHEEVVFLVQLITREAVTFTYTFSAKNMEGDSPYSRKNSVVYKQCSKGGDQELTRV